MKYSRKRNQFFIFIIDLIILAISLFLTLVIRNQEFPSFDTYLSHMYAFLIVWGVLLISMYTLNFYSLDIPFTGLQLPINLLFCSLFAVLFGVFSFYVFSITSLQPKTILVLDITISYLLILGWRYLYDYIAKKTNKKTKFVIVGYNETVHELINTSLKNNYLNFFPGALFTQQKDIPQDVIQSVNIISDTEKLKQFIDKNEIKVFVLPIEKEHSKEIVKILFNALSNKSIFYNIPEFYELLSRKIPLGSINESWFLQNISFQGRWLFNLLKRIVDLILSSIILLVTAIFWPIFAIIIKCESKGPVFFTQIREGQNGKLFKLYKFRTMKTESNDFAPTSKQDSRITKFGNFMRKTRIDELPQMLNVIKGDMSLVGPRPERPELATELEKEIPFYRQRLMVKPGITGWDQVSGEYHSPSVEDTYKKIQYDLYYIKNQSVFLEMSIFFKTIMTVFLKLGR